MGGVETGVTVDRAIEADAVVALVDARVAEARGVAVRVVAKAADDVTDEILKALFITVSSYGVRPVHPGTSVTLYAEPRRISSDGPILLTGTA